MFKMYLQKFLNHDRGAAAIEMALIMPIMLVLYFGMVDITQFISLNRKVTAATSAVADLVGQQRPYALSSIITDDYNAAYMILAPSPSASLRIDVYDYRLVNSVVTQMWTTNNGKGTSCGGNPSTTGMSTLMAAGNDVILARSCMTYTPWVNSVFGSSLMGATSFLVQQTITIRPRSVLTLNCYTSTPSATTNPSNC